MHRSRALIRASPLALHLIQSSLSTGRHGRTMLLVFKGLAALLLLMPNTSHARFLLTTSQAKTVPSQQEIRAAKEAKAHFRELPFDQQSQSSSDSDSQSASVTRPGPAAGASASSSTPTPDHTAESEAVGQLPPATSPVHPDPSEQHTSKTSRSNRRTKKRRPKDGSKKSRVSRNCNFPDKYMDELLGCLKTTVAHMTDRKPNMPQREGGVQAVPGGGLMQEYSKNGVRLACLMLVGRETGADQAVQTCSEVHAWPPARTIHREEGRAYVETGIELASRSKRCRTWVERRLLHRPIPHLDSAAAGRQAICTLQGAEGGGPHFE